MVRNGRVWGGPLAAALVALAASGLAGTAAAGDDEKPKEKEKPKGGPREPAAFKAKPPELEGVTAWLNGEPVKLADCKGKVVVLHFFAFGCHNCHANYPHYKAWAKDFANRDLVMVAIHTPETDTETKVDLLKQQLEKHGLTYRVAVDNDKKVWAAWDNRWWPCTYLIDKNGYCRYRWDGELNWQGQKGEQSMRRKIRELLAEAKR